MMVLRRAMRQSQVVALFVALFLSLIQLAFDGRFRFLCSVDAFSITGKPARSANPLATYSSADNNIMLTNSVSLFLHKCLWSVLTTVGTRRVIRVLCLFAPKYRDTIFYFDLSKQQEKKIVALTIDDGLSRSGTETCMVSQVLACLRRYNAHATLFVCANYCTADSTMKQLTQDLVRIHGHELGNHMAEDPRTVGYYARLDKNSFQTEFEQVNQVLEELVENISDSFAVEHDTAQRSNDPYRIQWFRSPQGIFTRDMHHALSETNNNREVAIRHVLGDCYCDDWALACKDPLFVVETMKRQVKEGSIVILHMPERGTDREACLQVLELLLQDLCGQGYRFVTLGQMWDECQHTRAKHKCL